MSDEQEMQLRGNLLTEFSERKKRYALLISETQRQSEVMSMAAKRLWDNPAKYDVTIPNDLLLEMTSEMAVLEKRLEELKGQLAQFGIFDSGIPTFR